MVGGLLFQMRSAIGGKYFLQVTSLAHQIIKCRLDCFFSLLFRARAIPINDSLNGIHDRIGKSGSPAYVEVGALPAVVPALQQVPESLCIRFLENLFTDIVSLARFKNKMIAIRNRDLLIVNIVLREGKAQVQAPFGDNLLKFILIVDICSCACTKEEPCFTRLRLPDTL